MKLSNLCDRLVPCFLVQVKVIAFVLVFIFLSITIHASSWPTIKLIATHNLQNNSTIIAFNNNMTRGLDPTYDAGLLKGGADLLIYSFLVQDYPGIPFAIQALPDKGYSILIIPIGLDFKTGGDVVISAELVNISPDTRIILEDKLYNKLTDLSRITYSVTVAPNSIITGRFLLHYSPPTIWNGTTSDWNSSANWSTNAVPTASDNVTISNLSNQPTVNEFSVSPAVCNNLTIGPDAVLTVSAGKAITINGTLTNNSSNGLLIQSNSAGTGSLIAGTTAGSGLAVVQRYMTMGAWHIVSSPLVQTIGSFLVSNGNIATNSISGARGIIDYNPETNSWNAPGFTNLSSEGLGAGKGFSMRTALNGIVTFSGSLQAGVLSVSGLTAGKWNCVGNPYTSAIGIDLNSNSFANFLSENSLNFDSSYGAIYIWNKPDSYNGQTGNYTVINNTSSAFDVQQGQAFMVKLAVGVTSVRFTPGMQIHNPELDLKKAKSPWPGIKLYAKVGDQISTTTLVFNSGMSKGLDPTYDAGLLKGTTDLVIYSRLVEDPGIPFAIQALPDKEYNTMIVPVGIDFKTGGAVGFSAELMNLPANCRAILEDKVRKTFTDISRDVYTVTIPGNSSLSDRFFLHTTDLISGSADREVALKLGVFNFRNNEIHIVGNVSNGAVATLFDVDGKALLISNLKEGDLNIISTTSCRPGVYILSVWDRGKKQGFKMVLF